MFVARNMGTSKIIMNTLLSASAGGIMATVLKPHVMGTYTKKRRIDTTALCNGILGGLVAVSAPCGNIQPWAAFMIGVISGAVYVGACKFLHRFGVDDPLEASAVHGFCGAWGVIATGIFDRSKGLLSSNTSAMAKFFGW